jgi:hypothetical protein
MNFSARVIRHQASSGASLAPENTPNKAAIKRETFMIKYFAIGISILALGVNDVSAGGTGKTAVDHALAQSADGRTIFAEFLLGAADMREKTAQQSLLARIDEWLAANFDLPHAAELPKVEYAPAAKIVALRYKGLVVASSDVTGSIPQTALERSTVAIYVDAEKTIYLPDDWSGRSLSELSVLVHEMAHHMQNLGGMRYECLRAREKLAYAAQDKFLELFGRDLENQFDVNPFTILVRSTCVY